jgi:Immunity protein 57
MKDSFRTVLGVVALLCLSEAQATHGRAASREAEPDDITQAQEAVLASVTVATSSAGARVCVTTPVSCLGPERIELAMSLIAARNTSASLRALASLVRFQLDGAHGEDYDELVLSKGKAILPFVSQLSPPFLHDQCVREYTEFVREYGAVLGDTNGTRVCRSEDAIKADIKLSLEAIQEGRSRQAMFTIPLARQRCRRGWRRTKFCAPEAQTPEEPKADSSLLSE